LNAKVEGILVVVVVVVVVVVSSVTLLHLLEGLRWVWVQSE
jgi:hypothetical protein